MDKISAKGMEHIHSKPDNLAPEVILCGCNRTGYPVLKKIVDMKKSVVVIDYNPNVIEKLSNEGIPTIYGDAADPEILDTISFDNLELFISTSQDIEDNLFLLKQIRERNKKAIIFLSASDVDEALVLYDKGCDYVIIPHFLGGIHASLLVEKFNQNIENLVEHKQQHLRELMERKKIGKHHPINK
jgi:Trk K+ transport system NAD-binding subunit